ncbi:ribonuclease P protein subunit p29 [Hesseltinella vesiculosa]|uniref:Ribonuclease P protein subunit p29 n=1 Tax=Hesseltinella vesiculosa TaxID=101127 RepID=A0A1X2GMG4_9FUNG|nr:ribonuclease P protein subunit p29 [Hesseltinella vesiculosa]
MVYQTTINDVLADCVDPSVKVDSMLKASRPIYLDGASSVIQKTKPQRKRKDRPLNAKERRQLKVYQVDPASLQYDRLLPLHDLWKGYISELKGQGQPPQQFAQKLLKADFHGAIMTVVQSKNPVYVGMSGIMIQETMNLFSLLTKENELKKIPKDANIFRLEVCGYSFKLYGKQLQFRSAERAAKKFKLKPTIDL